MALGRWVLMYGKIMASNASCHSAEVGQTHYICVPSIRASIYAEVENSASVGNDLFDGDKVLQKARRLPDLLRWNCL